MNQQFIYLASGSPRRRELLEQIGVGFRVHVTDVDESVLPGEKPDIYVCRLAREKAASAQSALDAREPVLGADTVVVLDGTVLCKPRDREDGLAMLARLSGRSHDVLTGLCLLAPGFEEVRLNRTVVKFRRIDARERDAYWNTGEPLDKAGAYAIQGIGAAFVERIEGSHSSVMGLPLFETAALLAAAGRALLPALDAHV